MHAKWGRNAERQAVNALNGPSIGWADGKDFFITVFNTCTLLLLLFIPHSKKSLSKAA